MQPGGGNLGKTYKIRIKFTKCPILPFRCPRWQLTMSILFPFSVQPIQPFTSKVKNLSCSVHN